MREEGFREKLRKLKSALAGEAPAPKKSGAPLAKKTGRPVAGLLTWPEAFKGELIAWRSPLHNSRLLIAYVPGMDPHDPLALVNCLVRDNRNFLPGMKLPARQVDERTYELVGPCPPRRGRWR